MRNTVSRAGQSRAQIATAATLRAAGRSQSRRSAS